jgi:hypothetical protein
MMSAIGPTRGVVYCALKNPLYLEAALISALALRQLEPDLPIMLLSDFSHLQTFRLERFNILTQTLVIPDSERLPNGMESRLIKTSLLQFTPFEQTLYLDADVLPIQPIAPIWDFLAQGNMALAVDVRPTISECDHVAKEEREYTLQRCSAATVQLNGGVMLWRNTSEVRSLFAAWKHEWLQFKRQDQLALVRAIQTTQTRVVELPEVYNFPAMKVNREVVKQNQVRLLHCLGGFVSGGRFRAIAEQLMPEATKLAIGVLGGK